MGREIPHLIELDPLQENPSRSCPNLHIKNRKPTDVKYITVFAVFFTVLFCLIGYCMYFGDISRITNGYDDCGTVCAKTPKIDGTNLKIKKCNEDLYQNLNQFGPYRMVIEDKGREKSICTDSYKKGSISGASSYLTTEIKDLFVIISEDIRLYWDHIMNFCLLACALSFGIILMFRYFAAFMVWIILVSVELACIGASIVLWHDFSQNLKKSDLNNKQQEGKLRSKFVGAFVFTIFTIVIGLLMLCARKKIKLIIQLFKEAGKAIADMPGLLAQSILTCLAVAVTISCWLYTCMWIGSSGHLRAYNHYQYDTNAKFYYQKDGWMYTADFLSIFGMFWMVQFIFGCQHIIVAGAVSKWYFTRNKSNLSFPISASAYNLVRYHLGSVALGSLIIALIKMVKLLVSHLRTMAQSESSTNAIVCIVKVIVWVCTHVLTYIEWILDMFTANAYIIIAMYGLPFFKAGKQAFGTITGQVTNFAAVNSIGDFILFMSKILVVVITEITAMILLMDQHIQQVWVFFTLLGIFSFCIAHCFITLYEMAIDTIFICFCEDSEVNDGLSKPYYMSRGLKEYVDNSRIFVENQTNKKKTCM